MLKKQSRGYLNKIVIEEMQCNTDNYYTVKKIQKIIV